MLLTCLDSLLWFLHLCRKWALFLHQLMLYRLLNLSRTTYRLFHVRMRNQWRLFFVNWSIWGHQVRLAIFVLRLRRCLFFDLCSLSFTIILRGHLIITLLCDRRWLLRLRLVNHLSALDRLGIIRHLLILAAVILQSTESLIVKLLLKYLLLFVVLLAIVRL